MKEQRKSARELNIEQAGSRCVHYARPNKDECAAGVKYAQFGECVLDRPCFRDSKNADACSQRRMPTLAECEAEVDEWDRAWDRLRTAILAIQAHAKGRRGIRDKCECPHCHKPLHYTVASYNGHIHAKCETKDCVSFMQ